MQEVFDALGRSISVPRLSQYRLAPTDTEVDLLARYYWNITLSEALHPALHIIEITLRNRIHTVFMQHFRTDRWFERPFMRSRERDSVLDAINELRRQGKHDESDRIIAELSFGFWTGLFTAHYEKGHIFWPHLLFPIVPQMPKFMRKRVNILDRLDGIRWLRNRVSHHEPIWNLDDLFLRYNRIIEALSWICPYTQNSLTVIDRFPDVYHNGLEQVRIQLGKLR